MSYYNPDKTNLNTREKGTAAEDLAVEFLLGKNFKIIQRNFYFGRYGEIDIVAEERETLVFVEVRSRMSKSDYNPIDTITPKKQNHLRRAAEGYLYVNKIYNHECRFDVIIIDFTVKPPTIEHFIQAL